MTRIRCNGTGQLGRVERAFVFSEERNTTCIKTHELPVLTMRTEAETHNVFVISLVIPRLFNLLSIPAIASVDDNLPL